MSVISCWILSVGFALGVENIQNTNKVETVKAAESMKVDKAKVITKADKAVEAVEVAEIERRKNEEHAKADKSAVDPWDAFYPPPDSEYDWIQLTSGEWLKGDFKVLYDYTIEFDSKEMDLQQFYVEDVRRMRTREMQTVFIQGGGGARDTELLRGMLEIRDDQLILRRSDKDLIIPRSQVISIANGRQRERDYWSGMVSVGVNTRGGNTETTDVNVMADIQRRTAASRFASEYISNYSESKKQQTANNQRLSGYYDRFLTTRFYWQLLSGEFYRDPFTNIDRQYSLSSGVGYDIIHSAKTDWTTSAGLGYQSQEFISVQVGDSDRSTSPFISIETRFDHEVNGSIDYLFDYSMRLLNKDNGRYTHHLLTKLSFDLMHDFDLDVSLVWDRIEKPQTRTDGTTPKSDDYQIIVSLAYDF